MTALRLVKGQGGEPRPLALDTLVLQLPPDVPVNLRRGGFQHIPRYDVATGELVGQKWQAPKQAHGINSAVVPAPDTGLVLNLSAKALLDNYPEGITRERLPQLADAIRATGIAEPSADDLLAADVKAADPTAAVHVGSDLPRYLRAFNIFTASGRFDVTPYDGEGIALNRPHSRGRDRLILYDKGRELTQKKAGRDFLADVSPAVAEWAVGTIRAERHARQLAPVRRCAGRERGRVSLADLYDTRRDPIADLYDEAAAGLNAPAIAGDFLDLARSGLSPGKIAGRLGRERVLEQLGYDLDRVEALLREADAIRGGHRNVHRELKEYRALAVARLSRREDARETAELHQLLLDFGRRLRHAA